MTAVGGAQAGVTELYLRHAGWLQRNLTGWGLTLEDAEDAVQETFIRALRTPCQLRDPKAARGYLAITARRVAVRMLPHHAETAVDPQSLTALAGADPAVAADRGRDAADLLEHLADATGHAIATLIVDLAAGRTAPELDLSPARVRRGRARAAAALSGTEWARRRPLGIGVVPTRTTPQVRAQIERLPFRQREVLTRHIYAGMTPAQIAWHLDISANSVRVSLHSARTTLGRQLGVDRDALTALLLSCRHTDMPATPGSATTITGTGTDMSTSCVLAGPWPAVPLERDTPYRLPTVVRRPAQQLRSTATRACSA